MAGHRHRAARRAVVVAALLGGLVVSGSTGGDAAHPDAGRRLILVTLDGARTEEIFEGMDARLARASLGDAGSIDSHPVFSSLHASTAEERRRRLMPFFWGTLLVHHGSIAGNPARGSRVFLRNRAGYSFPGYAEMLTGVPHDDVLDSNEAASCPSATILERVSEDLSSGRDDVAVFASWSRFERIAARNGAVLIDAGPGGSAPLDPRFPDIRRDRETVARAMTHLRSRAPRLLHLALGETDEWAHEGRYDRVLQAYQIADEALREIWSFIEIDPRYRGRTCLLVTTDHGRGRGPEDWRIHGPGIPGTEEVWMAFACPESARRGEWRAAAPVELGQVAPTIAAWMGVAPASNDRWPAPVPDVLDRHAQGVVVARRD